MSRADQMPPGYGWMRECRTLTEFGMALAGLSSLTVEQRAVLTLLRGLEIEMDWQAETHMLRAPAADQDLAIALRGHVRWEDGQRAALAAAADLARLGVVGSATHAAFPRLDRKPGRRRWHLMHMRGRTLSRAWTTTPFEAGAFRWRMLGDEPEVIERALADRAGDAR
jgi:hypothetical protein